MAATVALDDAREAIRGGDWFGDVFLLVAESDRESLREWYVNEPGLPNLKGRKAKSASSTGESCTRCGGLMVRTGACMTCQSCGESSGGCG